MSHSHTVSQENTHIVIQQKVKQAQSQKVKDYITKTKKYRRIEFLKLLEKTKEPKCLKIPKGVK